MALKIALNGQMLIGDAEFSAQQDVDVPLPTGGPWKPGRYTVAGLPVTAEITTVQAASASNNENYFVTIRGVTFSFLSDGTATVGEIRDGLRAAVDAGSLTVTTADVGGDAFSIQADVAGEGLKVSVDADTPADLVISARDSVPSALSVISRDSGQFTLRNPAAITARVGVMVAA